MLPPFLVHHNLVLGFVLPLDTYHHLTCLRFCLPAAVLPADACRAPPAVLPVLQQTAFCRFCLLPAVLRLRLHLPPDSRLPACYLRLPAVFTTAVLVLPPASPLPHRLRLVSCHLLPAAARFWFCRLPLRMRSADDYRWITAPAAVLRSLV